MSKAESWITTVDAVRDFRDQLDMEGRKLVFTNGCFDLLHAGHVRYLRQARVLGDGLVIALNSDASVRELKGDSRPLNTQEDRAEILMALQSVNGVVVFDEPRVTALIDAIRPHVYVKGGDYTLDSLNVDEKQALERVGASICLLPLVPGRSTTSTIERMQQGNAAEGKNPAASPESAVALEAELPAKAAAKSEEPAPAPTPGVETAPEPAASAPSSVPPAPSAGKPGSGSRITPRGAGSLSIQARPAAGGTTAEPVGASSAPASKQRVPAGAPLKLGILGSGQGTNFEAIQKAIEDGSLNAEIAVVISDVENSKLLSKARDAGLSRVFVDPGPDSRVLPQEAQELILEQLQAHEVQVVVLTGFMRVIKEPLLSGYKDRIVNIHPSLLPKFKGKAAWVQALEEGELETGCTVHLVNAEIDSGRILEQAVVPIHIGDTADDVFYRIQAEEHKLLPKVLHEWRERGLLA